MVPKIKVADFLNKVLPVYKQLADLSDDLEESSSADREQNAKQLMVLLCECGQLYRTVSVPWLLNVPNPVPKNEGKDLIKVGRIGAVLDKVIVNYKLEWPPPGPGDDLRIFYGKAANRRRVIMTFDMVLELFTPVSDNACRIVRDWGKGKKPDTTTLRVAKTFLTYALAISGLLALPGELGYQDAIPDAIQYILTQMSELGRILSQDVGFGMTDPTPIFPGNAITIALVDIEPAPPTLEYDEPLTEDDLPDGPVLEDGPTLDEGPDLEDGPDITDGFYP